MVDFLHVIDLVPERLSQYKLLIVPYPVMMSKSHIGSLIEYVKSGGTLVAEARCKNTIGPGKLQRYDFIGPQRQGWIRFYGS